MPTVRILLFATLKDQAGEASFDLELAATPATVAQVRQALQARYPALTDNLNSAVAAVNEEFAQPSDPVQDGDTVAFFPPVSGGSAPAQPEVYRLTNDPIDHDALIAAITTPDTGAVCLFTGMVRGRTDREGHLPQVAALEYEAYEPMALAKMRQVAQEIRARWQGVQGIAIVQRIGRLNAGENTVLIACSSAHRDSGCFEAARYGIDRLKEIVPVWKKEIGTDGEQWIEGDYTPDHTDRSNPV